MRAEAVSWDDWSVSNSPPIVNDDKWHVEVEPNDVKVVSLEQLDDLYRLSIVDSETKVWQAGMSDWQPLRVIAGLDEAATPPTPQARRAPPKPPSRVPSPSVRPAPPAPRQISPSVRPPAPMSRTMPMSQTVPIAQPAPLARTVVPAPGSHRPPASFYPEPILAAPATYPPPVAYAAPLTFAKTTPPMNSVRPLVVTQAPQSVQRGGGGFGRFLVGLALIAGVGITAYRNDYLREGAHAAHQDALYARLETALGGPAFGTVRALEQNAAAQPAPELAANLDSAVRTAVESPTIAAPATPSAPPVSAQTETHTATTTTPSSPPVVSLESLAPEKKGLAAAAALAPTPVRAVAAPVQAKPAAPAAAPAKAPPARAAASPKPVAEKPVVEKPAPVPQKPASEMTERERLNAAIGQSMMQADAPKAKGKKSKSKGNEYDPLNGNL